MALIQCPDCGGNVSSEAIACPNCARPMKVAAPTITKNEVIKQKKNSGGLLTFLIVIGAVAFIYHLENSSDDDSKSQTGRSSNSSQSSDAAAQQSIIKATPYGLYKTYNANEVATDNELKDHIIEISAPVMSIDKDFLDHAVLKFDTGDQFSALQATLSDDQTSAAATLHQGQVVTVHCTKAKRILQSPMLDNCSLVR